MRSLDDFSDITLRDEPLAPYTWLKIGGPAQYFVRPRHPEELAEVVRCCHQEGIPIHVLGGGSNVLVRDEGVSGVVLHLVDESFSRISIDEQRVTAGAGASLSHVISQSVKAGLAGLDALVGIPGTVGGALHGNAGGRSGDIGQHVRLAKVLTIAGEMFIRTEDELTFAYRSSSLNELVILEAEFDLHPEDPEEISRRMRKLWIMRKATQPLTFQSAGCIFKNPRGMSAGWLIDEAGLKGTRIGNAEISDRHANFVVSHAGATAKDVQRLIDLARSRVSAQFGVDLEPEVQIW
ncbi:MAG TPA: UDP-N-acetylmuramate dehydrogenase [Planctomycetaceae bacterium]|jgi:UDP-N-acetylmuramate dehydrogenase|nr:UDP-N-acetylmuramate dehydrogenase [Planctomycetaceae bacterium]